jgi:hypothetical protein
MTTPVPPIRRHTPGPWRVDASGHRICTALELIATAWNPRTVDEVRLPGESWFDMHLRKTDERNAVEAERIANAHLMAAAPDLLAALEAARVVVEAEGARATLAIIDAALERARG